MPRAGCLRGRGGMADLTPADQFPLQVEHDAALLWSPVRGGPLFHWYPQWSPPASRSLPQQAVALAVCRQCCAGSSSSSSSQKYWWWLWLADCHYDIQLLEPITRERCWRIHYYIMVIRLHVVLYQTRGGYTEATQRHDGHTMTPQITR